MAGAQTLPSRQRARVLDAYRGRGVQLKVGPAAAMFLERKSGQLEVHVLAANDPGMPRIETGVEGRPCAPSPSTSCMRVRSWPCAG